MRFWSNMGSSANVRLEGRVVDDEETFCQYMRQRVRQRVTGDLMSFAVELRG
ncbi:MAG: hypothetical protein OXI96_09600 [Acidimicrobiaceae bacterium]|nr:hypothetical protein [Acidimicrobiaceae bacterium]